MQNNHFTYRLINVRVQEEKKGCFLCDGAENSWVVNQNHVKVEAVLEKCDEPKIVVDVGIDECVNVQKNYRDWRSCIGESNRR